jgi:hypothetical protein
MTADHDDQPPVKKMQKRKRGRIVDMHIDGGEINAAGTGGVFFIAEDGTKLTADEAFQATDNNPVAAEPGKGPSSATSALVNAMVHYEKHSDTGISSDSKVRPTLRAIIQWAADYEFPNWKLLSEESSTQRALVDGAIKTLKHFPPK